MWGLADVSRKESRLPPKLGSGSRARAVILRGDCAPLGVAIHRASSITLRVAIETRPDDTPITDLRDKVHRLAAATDPGFNSIRQNHLAEHTAAMHRVRLELPTPHDAGIRPLSARLERLRTGATNLELAALWFAFGRYLLFASSRSCAHPTNLQGIWNEHLEPAWQATFISISTCK